MSMDAAPCSPSTATFTAPEVTHRMWARVMVVLGRGGGAADAPGGVESEGAQRCVRACVCVRVCVCTYIRCSTTTPSQQREEQPYNQTNHTARGCCSRTNRLGSQDITSTRHVPLYGVEAPHDAGHRPASRSERQRLCSTEHTMPMMPATMRCVGCACACGTPCVTSDQQYEVK